MAVSQVEREYYRQNKSAQRAHVSSWSSFKNFVTQVVYGVISAAVWDALKELYRRLKNG